MSRVELAQRLLCSRGRIDLSRFRRGLISSRDRTALVEAAKERGQAPLYVDDSPSRSVVEIGACARRLTEANLGLVIIDYLQLVQPDSSKDPRQEQVAKISRRLKGLARELAVPVLCLAQLNRQVEAGNLTRPKLSHLRESGAIEQDADVVLLLQRDEWGLPPGEAAERGVAGLARVDVAKQRNGPVGEVSLQWLGNYVRFQDFPAKSADEFGRYAAGAGES
jgi:replicative DNA helicase